MTPSYKVFLILLVAILLAGCSKLKNENTSSASGGGTVATNSSNAPSAPSPPASTTAGTPTTWEANAAALNGKQGETLTLSCSPGGSEHTVWGSDIFTTDSSVCTAAVYSGLITYQQGGTVTIEARPGRPIYGCGERNGVTTSCYGAWADSFVFPKNADAIRDAEDRTLVTWNANASVINSEDNKPWKFKCPADGKQGNVWGTDTYTADSSICNAAVHAGKFSRAEGGAVTIELQPGKPSYQGTTRNGVTSQDYGQYSRSFVIK